MQQQQQRELINLFGPLLLFVGDNEHYVTAKPTQQQQHIQMLQRLPLAIFAMLLECFHVKNIVTCTYVDIVARDGGRLKQIVNDQQQQQYEICLAAVQHWGRALQWVCESMRTPEIYLAAVKNDGHALMYITKPTPDICLAAVQQNWAAFDFVREQTPEICLAAVQQNGLLLQLVYRQTPDICMAAVRQDGNALQFVDDQNFELCLAAVQQNAHALKYVFQRRRNNNNSMSNILKRPRTTRF